MPQSNLILQVFSPQEKQHKRFPIHLSLFQKSEELARNYAKKVNADYYIHKDRYFPNEIICFEKFVVWNKMFEKYEKIFFVDIDALITPSCPNIFLYNDFSAKSEPHDIDFLEKRFIENKRYKYFNSGVMLLTKNFLDQTRNVYLNTLENLKPKYQEIGVKLYDQMVFNYLVAKHNPEYNQLDIKWNIAPNKQTGSIGEVKENFIIHYMRNRKNWFDETLWN